MSHDLGHVTKPLHQSADEGHGKLVKQSLEVKDVQCKNQESRFSSHSWRSCSSLKRL